MNDSTASEPHEVVEGCLDCPHPGICAGMGKCVIGAAKLAERSAAWIDLGCVSRSEGTPSVGTEEGCG